MFQINIPVFYRNIFYKTSAVKNWKVINLLINTQLWNIIFVAINIGKDKNRFSSMQTTIFANYFINNNHDHY